MKKLIIATMLSIGLLAKPAKADAGLITVFVATFVTYFAIHYAAIGIAKAVAHDNNVSSQQSQ